MKYVIDGETTFYDIADVVEYCLPDDYFESDEDGFDYYLNENYSSFEICGHDYSPAEAFYSVDESAYGEAMSEWAANELEIHREDATYDLEHRNAGEYVWIESNRVEIFDEDDENEEEENETCDDLCDLCESAVKAAEQENLIAAVQKQADEDDFMALFQTIG